MVVDKWMTLHDYRRLAQRGNIPPIRCKMCQQALMVAITNDTEPMFRCFPCGVKIYPGEDVFTEMQDVINGKRRINVFEL